MESGLITAATSQTSATPIWVENFVAQYQMTDTSCCAEAIFSANRSTRWNQSLTVGGASLYDRDSDQLHFTPEGPPAEHEPILAFAQECLDHYTKERKQAGNVPQFGLPEGYSILRYKPGEAYHAVHSDAGWPNLAHRHVTLGLFLNTIAEGGELEFPDQNLRIPAVEGRAVIFPAQWMYAHRSLPASSDRYVFNLFYGFMPPPPA